MNLPRVSVCLLTYNRASVLPRTLESLLEQTHRDFELIINDDRSTDETESVCREFERLDPRVKYYRNRGNLRYARNQTAALLRASTDYVAIVHDGDVYRPDLLERWTASLIAHPSAALVFNAYDVMNDAGGVVHTYHSPFPPLIAGLDLFDYIIERTSSPIWGIVMVRRSALMAVEPFDPRFPTLADVDMWLRLLLRFDAAYIDEPLLRVAPREAGHYNSGVNWRVREEHELIFALNAARRYPANLARRFPLQARVEARLWRMRAQTLAYAFVRGDIAGLWSGVRMIARRPRATSVGRRVPNVTWQDAGSLL